MRMNRTTNHCAAWIASFAIFLAALAPSVFPALAASGAAPASWVEICSVAGSRLVMVDGSQELPAHVPAQGAAHLDHCPFCLGHSGSTGIPPSAGFAMPVARGAYSLPSLSYRAPRPLSAWSVAHPRAPPALA